MKILIGLLLAFVLPGFVHADALGEACGTLAAEVSGGDANVVVPLPTHQAGDILIGSFINHGDNTVSSATGSTTWTAKETDVTTSGFDVFVYWTRAASSSDSSVTVTFASATGGRFGRVCSIRGALATGDPIEAFSNLEILITDPDTASGVTSVSANALICGLIMESADDITNITYAPTSPASLTRVGTIAPSSTDDDALFDFACAAKAAAGATGNIAVDYTGTLNGSYFMAIAVTSATGSAAPYQYYFSGN